MFGSASPAAGCSEDFSLGYDTVYISSSLSIKAADIPELYGEIAEKSRRDDFETTKKSPLPLRSRAKVLHFTYL